MLGDDMNDDDPEAMRFPLLTLVFSFIDSYTDEGVATAQRSASQSSRYLDTKPGDEVKALDVCKTGVADSSDRGLEIGLIAVSV